ncbi:hypothetical protein ENUP19_0100G0016 [Entamoeba nuttalli]|uniref:Uncharacterized protein n=2 Tax=Entamoeba nuttalli TaxID=412467 RepID=K2GT99_ENTNP|nr:hypothetical protein ENU1_172600 [Entamoeba nuttalli P19]EKE38228.1 hypothetical protein ENU1_172600 [Entamoeba nuttalli P19]|eukprot:XP_008859423.1 hypothetical protein ENU1_172600 [Entamoeba nuttalli P19]
MSCIQEFIKKNIEGQNGTVTYMDIVLKFENTTAKQAQDELKQYQKEHKIESWEVGIEENENEWHITNNGECYMLYNNDFKEELNQSMTNYFKSGKSEAVIAPKVITTTHTFKSDLLNKEKPKEVEKKIVNSIIKVSEIPETKKPQQPDTLKKENDLITSGKSQKKLTAFFNVSKKSETNSQISSTTSSKKSKVSLDNFFKVKAKPIEQKTKKRTLKPVNSDDEESN